MDYHNPNLSRPDVEQLIRMVWAVAYNTGQNSDSDYGGHAAWIDKIGQPPEFDILDIDKWEAIE